jgi:threonine/homoserine/homoserine lactone efflux protein
MSEHIALLTYLFVMFVTPGPNNVMLTASGLNFGFRRTVPHMLGICLGVALQLLLCALLISVAATWIAAVRKPLALLGCAYLVWLALKIAQAGRPESAAVARPLGVTAAALFQNLNPKAWIMVANTAVLFMPRGGGIGSALVLGGASVAVGLPACVIWAWSGERLRTWLRHPLALRAFNWSMAVLLALTAAWLLADELAST